MEGGKTEELSTCVENFESIKGNLLSLQLSGEQYFHNNCCSFFSLPLSFDMRKTGGEEEKWKLGKELFSSLFEFHLTKLFISILLCALQGMC
jgi:hypothetical protein